MADYISQFTGAEIDSRLAKVPQLESGKQDNLVSGSNIKTINGQSVLGSGDMQIQAGDTDAVKYVAQTLTDAQKAQARTNIAAASAAELGQIVTDLTGIEADIDSLEAAVQAINVGDYVTATTLPTASASTMGHIYLIGPDANNNYDRYFTQESSGSYSWVSLGSTQIDLSTYATQAEVDQLEAEVNGEQNTQEITIPTTSGSPVPTQTKYDVVFAVGRAYSVHWDKGTSGITAQPFIYFYDSDGTRVTAYTKNGNASITYEPLSLNSDDVFVFQSAVAKVALYVAGTSVPNTGEAELSISYRGVGLVSKVAGLEEKTEDLEDSVDGLSQSISVLDVEVNGIPGFDAEQSVNATSGTGIPSSTRYPMELTANTRYLVTFEGLSGIVSSIALYLRDADGLATTNFYNLDDTPASESFDSSLSSKYMVPQSDTTLIAFYSTSAQVVGTGTIKCKVTKQGVAGLTDDIAELAENIDGIEENIAGIEEKNNTYDAVIKATDVTSSATRTTEKYAKYENGAIVVAGIPTAMEILQISVVGVSVVRAYATAQDNVPAIIAFYAGTPSNSTYIKDASVQASAPYNSGRWFEAEVPTNAKFVVVSNRYAVVSSPKIELLTIPAVSVVADEVSKKPNFSVSPFWKSLFYSHFNPISLMMDGHGRKLIAGESLADIRVASRLGFDIIEANLHETSDGVIICTHGDNGFGPAFIDLSTGVMPSGDISSFSYDYVLQNIRYNSDLDKYKTPPPTLDQFLACCKANGIGAMVGVTMLSEQGAIDAINKARSILNDKIIVYTGTSANSQREYFPGYFLRWFSGSSVTYQGIVDDMNAVGSPAICGLNSAAISALKTAGKYDDLIGFLHANGFLYAVAYLTEEEERDAIADGCDLIASNHEVNFFEGNGLAVDINDDVPQFVLANASLSDGVITMSNGGTITIGTTDKVGLGKGMLKLRFDGSLTVDFGSIGVRSISSDGTEDIVISDYFLVRKERVVITATSATTIYDLVYNTSRC